MDWVTIYTPGHLDMYDSYGLLACELARHIERLGVSVNLLPLGDRLVDNQPPEVRRIAARPLRMGFGGLLLGYPTSYDKFSPVSAMGPRVSITMFESTQLPSVWAPILSEVDSVIVPSRFCQQVFRDNGVTSRVSVAPLGLNPIYQPVQRDASSKPFTFLTFMDRGRRKGAYHAIQAFLRAFGDDPDYKLLVKTRQPKDMRVNILNSNIESIQKDMMPQELYELYQQAHVLVNPNLGEGFGLIPREFAASGGLAMTSDWGGTADQIGLWALPIPVRSTVPAWQGHPDHEGLGMWANPDVDEIAELMKYVAANRHMYMSKAMHFGRFACSHYRWDRFARQVLAEWRRALHGYARTERTVTS